MAAEFANFEQLSAEFPTEFYMTDDLPLALSQGNLRLLEDV
jgi:hypothetical protein